MKIFLRSPNWIGDCVMSLPAIRALKDSLPEIKIVIITKSHLRSVYKNIPEISEIVEIPQGNTFRTFLSSIKILRDHKISVGILLTNSFQSALVMKLAGVRNLTGYSKDLRGWMLKKKMKFPGKSIHQITSYIDLIKLFVGTDIKRTLSNRIIFDEQELNDALGFLETEGFKQGERLVAISPAAAYGSSKEWPADRFSKLINDLSREAGNIRFVFFGSGKDNEKIGRIVESVSEYVIVITEKYSLREAMAMISLCDIFIGNDSGLLHVADGTGVPSIGIFGPTSPEATSPPGDNTETVYKGVECAPCSFRECPIDHKCMKQITVSEICYKIINQLNKVKS